MSKPTVHKFTVEVETTDPFEALRALSYALTDSGLDMPKADHRVLRIESHTLPVELCVEFHEPDKAA